MQGIIIFFAFLLFCPFGIIQMVNYNIENITIVHITSILYYSIFCSVIAYIFWFLGISKISAGSAAVYTGIMPICKDEKGVAVVMGHEVAHAIANHGAERMSQGMIQQMGGVALDAALADKPNETRALFGTAYGLASNYGAMLPFSRLHESEADKMGLIFMAMAGYDPREAPKFWERMAANSGGGAPPEFMSTHPSHDTRINDLNAQIPEAMKYYKK